MPIKALALNCTLKSVKSGETSSTNALLCNSRLNRNSTHRNHPRVAKRILERIDASIEELDDDNRMKTLERSG
jgi:hypothetical protein